MAVKKYMLAGKLLSDGNNICILRDLIEVINRLLVHQYEVAVADSSKTRTS